VKEVQNVVNFEFYEPEEQDKNFLFLQTQIENQVIRNSVRIKNEQLK
jgi:hypothetical protein